MSLLALRPREQNVLQQAQGGAEAGAGISASCPGVSGEAAAVQEEPANAYPGWLLEHRRRRCFTIHDFKISNDCLGSGKFGKAYRAKERASNRVVIIKAILKQAIIDEGLYKQFQREVETHSRICHPNIIRMYAYFHDAARCYLVLELASGGNLYTRLAGLPYKRMDERAAALYIRQLCSALAHLHKRNVLHRDIKPENILICIDKEGKETIKLADFGWCVAQRPNSRVRTTFCGTPEYLPPEVCKGQLANRAYQEGSALPFPESDCTGEYDSGFDMYDVGVLLYEMLAGRPPFQHHPEDTELVELMSSIASGKLRLPKTMTQAAGSLIKALMAADPAARPSAQDVLAHPWIVQHAGHTDAAEWDY